MHIQSIPMCTFPGNYGPSLQMLSIDFSLGVGSSDNYAYLVVDDKSKDAVIIDPANPSELVFTILTFEVVY